MKICLVTPERPPFAGGIATYTTALARILTDAGHSILVLCTDSTPPQRSPAVDDLRIVDLCEPRKAWQRQVASAFSGRHRDVHQAIASGLAVRDWLLANSLKESIDVVEVPDYQGIAACLEDTSLPACVVAGHGTIGQIGCHSGVGRNVSSPFAGTLESLGLACGDAVVCHSHSYRREIAPWVGREVLFASAPFEWAKRGKSLRRRRGEAGVGAGQPVRLVVLGRLQPCKGPEVLCDALRIVRTKVDVMVDWYGRSVHAAASNCDMAHHIAKKYPDLWDTVFKWHAPLPPEQVMSVLADADALVIASVWETFGYTAVEAVAAGTPVIISEGAGASYLFGSNESGIVFRAGDVGRLANAIEVIADGGARSNLASASLERLKSELAEEKVAAERIASYQVALSRKAARRASPYFPGGIGAVMAHLCSGNDDAEARDVATLSFAELLGVVGARAKRRISRAIWGIG